MKVMFVENKQQTQFWEAVAVRLQKNGHEVCWIVQNAAFLPAVGESFLIPYPNGNGTRPSIAMDAELQRILSSDRNINYFGGDSSHYSHYDAKICRLLGAVKPDVVFGEATLFHELLCIKHCCKREIPYFQLSSCRYPPGRFSFYFNETQIPFQGSGEVFSTQESLAMACRITRREVEPSYMKKKAQGAVCAAKLRRLWNGLKITGSYMAGEHYNTPSPATKFLLEYRSRKNKLRWEKLASRARAVGSKFRILYPMQMQPESSIDVWGNAYRDQTKLLALLLQSTHSDTVIVVKPNPKSKYELSNELVELVASSDRLIPVPHRMSMKDVLKKIDLIVTVTGTVAIEAIFAGWPVVTLVETLNNTVPGCVYVENLNSLASVICQVRQGAFPKPSEAEKLTFLNLLTCTSYRGIISNPYSTPTCLSDENLRDVDIAFRDVLKAIPRWKKRPEDLLRQFRSCAGSTYDDRLKSQGNLATLPS
jgi:hypothetical protein